MKARKLFLLLEVAIAAPLLVAGVNLGLFLAGIEVDIPSADLVDQRVVTYDAASNTLKLVTAPGGGAGDVTAGANLANNGVVTGDGGAKGVKTDSVATLVAGLFTTANVSATDAGVTSPSVFVTGGGNDDPDLVVTGDGTVSGLFTTANVSATDAGVTSPSIFVTGGGNSDPDLVVTGDVTVSGNTSITGGISGAFVTGSVIEPSDYTRTPKLKFTDGTEQTTAGGPFSGDVSTTANGYLSDSGDGIVDVTGNLLATGSVSATEYLDGSEGLMLEMGTDKGTVFKGGDAYYYNDGAPGALRQYVFKAVDGVGSRYHRFAWENYNTSAVGYDAILQFGSIDKDTGTYIPFFSMNHQNEGITMGATIPIYWSYAGGASSKILGTGWLNNSFTTDFFLTSNNKGITLSTGIATNDVVVTGLGNFRVETVIVTNNDYGEVMVGTDASGDFDLTVNVTADHDIDKWSAHVTPLSNYGSGLYWADSFNGGLASNFTLHGRGMSATSNVSFSWSGMQRN